jgi:hypothetical protein
MADKITIEIAKELRDDLLQKATELRDKYYATQVNEKDPGARNKILENFMRIGNIIEQLESWKN